MAKKRWQCRLGLHRYRKIYDHERAKQLKECRYCGRRTVAGWPEGALPPG
jgi:hypothetical protein